MVLKHEPVKVIDLMAMRHREQDDPDEEFLDRLQKKTSFYEQPSAPPEALNPPAVQAAAASLDDLADIKIDAGEDTDDGDGELQTAAPAALGAEAALAAAAAAAERERREARYASLFEGRSAGERQQGGVPEGLTFSRLSARPDQRALPIVGCAAASPEEAEAQAEAAAEDAARRAAWRELNRLREERGLGDAAYQKAYERFVATWGHRGAELRD
ncbi:hypothetical protein ABPG75_014046 [Micractinium tetrahymenae]